MKLLSIVVTARNDNHGGNMLHRMQVFVNGLAAQCEKFNLNAELIVVEWNPPQDQKHLSGAIRWPQPSSYFTIRFIEVSPEVHNRIENSDKIPLFQMIAKNAGIRRAKGDFVLTTNIDILFSDELMWFLAGQQINPDSFYRVCRYDVGNRVIPTDISIEEQLDFCRHNVVRIQDLYGTEHVKEQERETFFNEKKKNLLRLSPKGLEALLNKESNGKQLFGNACGDFTLMDRDKWFLLKGHPELPLWSIHVDEVFLHMAHVTGISQIILPDPMRIYHIEHDMGWALTQELVKERPSLDYKKDCRPWFKKMHRDGRPITPNNEDWGLAKEKLKEYTLLKPLDRPVRQINTGTTGPSAVPVAPSHCDVPALTMFAIPKPFVGNNTFIQWNAITSWSLLRPRPDIILLGDDPGTAELARALGLKHVPEIKRNEFGTPLLNSIFELAEAISTTDWLAYVNADVILLKDFGKSLVTLRENLEKHSIVNFMLSSQRRELDIKHEIPFNKSNWQEQLCKDIENRGVSDYKAAIEMFFYNRGLLDNIPPFAIGRTVWDQWLVWKAKNCGAAIIDATEAFTLIHQSHDYTHLTGGYQEAWNGIESQQNKDLAQDHRLHLDKACTHIMTQNSLMLGSLPYSVKNRTLVERRYKRGLEELENRHYAAALDYFDDAINRGGTMLIQSLHHFRAVCLIQLKRYKEAEASLLEELRNWPNNTDTKKLLSTLKNNKLHNNMRRNSQKSSSTGIIVFGHTRVLHLKSVLESLRRQRTENDIHVWLDGHHGRPSLKVPVEECRKLVLSEFPKLHLTAMNGNMGIEKLMIDGLSFMSERYKRIIVLEDDCFPTSSGVAEFEKALDEIEHQPEVYSVYGHHFLTPSEGETITRFQGWGWATTKEKLLPVLTVLKRCFAMSEPEYLQWVQNNLTPELIAKLDITPGRNCIGVMSKFFSWDSCTCLLTAIRCLVHKKIPKRIIYNCGMGKGGNHFSETNKFRGPPFNMIMVGEVWDYFDDTIKKAHVPIESVNVIIQTTRCHLDACSVNQHGETLFGKGDIKSAIHAFKKALDTDPGFVTAHNNLGVLYWQTGETDKAIEHLKKALDSKPNDRHTILNYATILKAMNQKGNAQTICSSYLQHHPEDSEIVQLLKTL